MYEEDPRQEALVIVAFIKLLSDVHVLGDREIAEGDLIRPNANNWAVLGEERVDGFTLLESERV